MSLPKVLVATSIFEGKDYSFAKWVANVKRFNYPNFDVLVVDNSSTSKYVRSLRKRFPELNIVHVNRGGNSRAGVANSLNFIREYIIRNGYDYWMSIESDLYPPDDVIQRLMRHGKLVVGSMYVIGYPKSKSQPPRFCLFGVKRQSNGELETFNLSPEDGSGLFASGVVKVHGCGLGSTLLSVELLKRIRFWWIDEQGGVPKHPDVFMYMDLHNMKVDVYCDTDLIVPHWNSDWNKVKDI